ncbi:NF-kappa-B-repressing factor isoform X2 [Acyrthosiphon pisum]|nr:NF-kappa-B-repressing factor isoform X2 [Acyrthosiphon pisum]|eukprot:XP_016657265.1 PREDICTED: NF-kappa-B-repressing factor isoform X2 [Acyrthosiphon pisum]
MGFDTLWNVNDCKSMYESSEQWKFRQSFLIANKKKYPRDRLVILCHIFMHAEFMKCEYPKPTMDLIENLSKDFVDDLRNKLNCKVPKISMTDSNAAGAKDNENAETCTTSNIKNNQPPDKLMRYLTPYDNNCIRPGFILKVTQGACVFAILTQSCSFSGIAQPQIVYEHLNSPHVRARLYIEKKLIAVDDSNSEKQALRNVSCIAYNILKEMCFTIKVKAIDKQSQITMSDIVNDSTFDEKIDSNTTTYYSKISDNNVGNKILKNMGWKEGDGLGKNNQGITSPIEIIRLKKRGGLGISDCETNLTNLNDFKIQAKKYIMRFLNGPKKRISFSSEFTKEDRMIIHSICTKVGLKAKSYGTQANRYLVVVKIQNPQDIYYELRNCINFENDCYVLIPPLHESNNT